MSLRMYATLAAGIALGCDAPAMAEPISQQEAEDLRREVAALKAQLKRMEDRLGPDQPQTAATAAPAAVAAAPAAVATAPAAPAPVVAAAPAAAAPKEASTSILWRGSPQFGSGDRAFKVKGRIQADTGIVDVPRGTGDRGFGFASEFRRIRLGGEGKLGSNFGYKLELELSDNAVDLVDTFVTYDAKPWLVTLGNQNQFQSLDEVTGDTTGSFMERAAYTDAFNFERRLGVSVQYQYKALLLQGGIFTDDITALSNASDGPSGGDENNSFSIDGRIVYAPKVGDTQFHAAASAHRRKLARLTDSQVRYRQRPYLHVSNSRILATPVLNVEEELNYGVEAAAIRGPLHAAAEGHWLEAKRPGNDTARFFGAYAEVGYFLTKGDSRSYRGGIFGGADPKHPLGKGGIGAVQVNLRYDYLDLNSGRIRGGTQDAYLAAIIWTPINYLRFNLNYGYLDYKGAAIPANGRTDYGAHVTGARIELDF